MFGSRAHRRAARAASSKTGSRPFVEDLKSLAVGDFVVHVEHGIGKYLGLVHKRLGSEGASGSAVAAAQRAMTAGVHVALASRCPAGRATAGYAFPGGGATWLRAGALPVGHLCALKARVALALGIGAGLDRDGLIALLADPAD